MRQTKGSTPTDKSPGADRAALVAASAPMAQDLMGQLLDVRLRLKTTHVSTARLHARKLFEEEVNARFMYLSTDFVSDGTKGQLYQPTDAPKPVDVYGKSEWGGKKLLEVTNDAPILRTERLYGGQMNEFVDTALQRMRSYPGVKVLDDQVGTPAELPTLDEILWKALDHSLTRAYHRKNAGGAS